jgi:hypothetical protein
MQPTKPNQPPTLVTIDQCGKTGHWAKDCELQFDICHMTMDELETIMENHNAALDVAPSKLTNEEEPIPVEDFVSHSR